MEHITQKLEALEEVLEGSWNDEVGLEDVAEALQEAILLARDQHYLYASITDAATRAFEGEDGEYQVIRAIACADPGTQPRLFLERIVFGAEDMPLAIARRVEVRQPAVNRVGDLRFEGDQLRFAVDPGEGGEIYSVTASPSELGEVASASG